VRPFLGPVAHLALMTRGVDPITAWLRTAPHLGQQVGPPTTTADALWGNLGQAHRKIFNVAVNDSARGLRTRAHRRLEQQPPYREVRQQQSFDLLDHAGRRLAPSTGRAS